MGIKPVPGNLYRLRLLKELGSKGRERCFFYHFVEDGEEEIQYVTSPEQICMFVCYTNKEFIDSVGTFKICKVLWQDKIYLVANFDIGVL